MNIIGQISNVEFSKSKKNKKGKRVGFSGIVIEFETNDKLVSGSILEINFNGKLRPFEVCGLSTKTTDKSKSISIEAKETGYFANKLSNDNNFDIITLLGIDVSLVTDENRIKKIKESSYYC